MKERALEYAAEFMKAGAEANTINYNIERKSGAKAHDVTRAELDLLR